MNRLSKESSPYLLQHKNNPVDWFPWGDEAFEIAQKENKLILVSIGYSACHWCHVMEKECFEDNEVATFMNKHFVNIKVDREERPDVDQMYMEAVQLMTNSGGWPLNCFTLPNGKPFYGGTYYPKEKWLNTLGQLIKLQKDNTEKIKEYANNLTEKIKDGLLLYETSDEALSKDLLLKGVEKWSNYFDYENGGVQGAPKFPLPNNLLFLLKHFLLTNDEGLKNYILHSLEKMAQGGIYDQIGGGFSRYSVDAIWKVPHFEKMLYDNAQLINLYASAYSLSNNNELKNVVSETIEFCKRELMSSQGFYSALDADSEGVEGKYYVWSTKELKTLLKENYDFAELYFNFNSIGEWEESYIPLRQVNDSLFSKNQNIDSKDLFLKKEKIKTTLLIARDKRIRPGTDNKILTGWNALLISALAKTSLLLGNDSYLDLAEKTASVILHKHLSPEGVLYRTLRKTEPINGFLDDYALLAEAFISLYKATGKEYWINQAKQITDLSLDKFYDEKTQLFFFSERNKNKLAAQQVDMRDDVIPSSGSVIANNLYTLGIIYENAHYSRISETLLKKVTHHFNENLFSYSNWGILLQKKTYVFKEVVIVGENALGLLKELGKTLIPNTLIIASTKESELPIFKNRFTKGETFIFVCENNTCKTPVKTIEEVKALLTT